jgi:hypothetical protein
LPLIGGAFQPALRFEAELQDPVRDRKLGLAYSVDPVRWLS